MCCRRTGHTLIRILQRNALNDERVLRVIVHREIYIELCVSCHLHKAARSECFPWIGVAEQQVARRVIGEVEGHWTLHMALTWTKGPKARCGTHQFGPSARCARDRCHQIDGISNRKIRVEGRIFVKCWKDVVVRTLVESHLDLHAQLKDVLEDQVDQVVSDKP